MNENSAWLREQRQKAQLEAERAFAERKPAADAAEPDAAPTKDSRGRKTRTCSICRAAGLVDEATGHISIGHDAWLAQQPPHMQAHFKGQGATGQGAPRLVKPSADSDSD